MAALYIALENALAVVTEQGGRWTMETSLDGLPVQCVASHPHRPEHVYCGTFGRGLWRSTDAGATWQPAGEGIEYGEVMAVAVSLLEQGVVWAGTEPSALYRSEDGGATWQERAALRDLPSAPTWSFPPRPWTHHVRWIAPDPTEAGRLFVGIELGGVMRSLDGGLTWEDRKPGGQHDAHTLATHRLAPGRVYETAGGGYAESHDGGASWRRDDAGLSHHYLWGLAVDPGDPDTIIISAAAGPREAHQPGYARSTLYRRTAGSPWQEVRAGLPPVEGRLTAVLAASEAEPGVFYLASNQGLYRSTDAGANWEPLPVPWPRTRPQGIVAV